MRAPARGLEPALVDKPHDRHPANPEVLSHCLSAEQLVCWQNHRSRGFLEHRKKTQERITHCAVRHSLQRGTKLTRLIGG